MAILYCHVSEENPDALSNKKFFKIWLGFLLTLFCPIYHTLFLMNMLWIRFLNPVKIDSGVEFLFLSAAFGKLFLYLFLSFLDSLSFMA